MLFKSLVAGFSLAAASTVLAAPYAVDPIAALPYVTQQLGAQVAQPQFSHLESFRISGPNRSCADFGWSFEAYSAYPGATGTSRLGTLKLWLAAQNGQCVWQRYVEVHDGFVGDAASLNDAFNQRQILAPDVVANTATTSLRSPLTIDAIALSAAQSTAGPNATYLISGRACGGAAAITVDARSGAVVTIDASACESHGVSE